MFPRGPGPSCCAGVSLPLGLGRALGVFLLWTALAMAGSPGERSITDADRNHWAFRPLQTVVPPGTHSHPVDALLFRGGPLPAEAPRRVLIRRLCLDLLGLPPAPEQVEAFEADPAPDAPTRLADQLLASRHFGERWARHWLDVARYADSDGYESDLDRKEAWPYRDWVIRAFNDDLPFNTFVQWQVAGDEWAPGNPDAVAATGFLAAAPFEDTTPADTEENKLRIRYDELDDMVSTTASAFLGLTLACARCHDHKFDPLPTRDYYRMMAAFSTAERRVASLSKPRREWEAWREQQRTACRESRMSALGLTDEQKFWLRQPEHFFVPVQTALYKEYGARLKVEDSDLRQWLTESGRTTWDALESAANRSGSNAVVSARCLGVMDRQSDPLPQFLLGRGSVLNRKEPVTAGFLQVMDRGKAYSEYWKEVALPAEEVPSGVPAVDANGFIHPPTTYQRSALARWLTDVDRGAGALTARVIVNRIWQHHFGEGLVRTPNDFGTQGDAPSHPELLEWLAGELVRQQWHLKPIHRLIVTSAAYRQKADGTPGALRRPVRLDSDALFDSILAVSGRLNRRMFGPPFRPLIPKEAMATRSKDEYPTNLQDGPDLWRRSVYAFAKRSVPNPMTEVFDAPNGLASCGRRNVTTVPTQALTLMNSDWVRKSATQFAQRVITEAGLDPRAQVRRAYALALARLPSDDEWARVAGFLSQAPDATGAALPVEGLTDLCHVLLTLNEFIYVE
ncbi:MAG: DUF1553 domain-containing protein [Verrucomicrobiales bacterium]|nr:DUF1553 domain-containing protein [Verrucomicrobiales bacterium]